MRILVSLLGMMIAVLAVAATPTQYEFSFVAQIENADPVSQVAVVQAGTSKSVQLTPHLKWTIDVPANVSWTTPLLISLADDTPGSRLPYYKKEVFDAPVGGMKFFYRVCKGAPVVSDVVPDKHEPCGK